MSNAGISEDGLYIGVMSGTSLDGVDVALVDCRQGRYSLQAAHAHPYPQPLRDAVLSMCQNQPTTISQVARIDHQLGQLYAEAVNALLRQQQLAPGAVRAIGCHGQTVWHEPQGDAPTSVQLGDANLVAELTGIAVVADLRRRDMACGGQGAPLVPAFHQAVFAADKPVAVLNIGGIANLTLLAPGGPVVGFDCGPGNMLLDAWIGVQRGARYDADARWAQSGQVNAPLLRQLLSDPYLALPAPKSTGREHYNLAWLQRQLFELDEIAPQDVQATLAEFTVRAIVDSLPGTTLPAELLVCGGGAHNPLLMRRLGELLPGCRVTTTAARGVDPDQLEAMAFAWLAAQHLAGQPGSLPSVTGAGRPATLGCLYPGHFARNQ